MKVWTNTEFQGHWPVGTSAVVVAETVEQAALLLDKELQRIGLSQAIDPKGMILVPMERAQAIILQDGDY